MDYRERQCRENNLVDRLWCHHLSDFDYTLSEETIDEIYSKLLSTLGDGSRQDIRNTIDEAKWIARQLEP